MPLVSTHAALTGQEAMIARGYAYVKIGGLLVGWAHAAAFA
jgi:hypothetical protein